MYANNLFFYPISPTSHLSSVIAIKRKLKKHFATKYVVILHFTPLTITDQSNTYHHIPFEDPELSGAHVAPHSQFERPFMGNLEV